MLQKKAYIFAITLVTLVIGANIWISIINNPNDTTIPPDPFLPPYVCQDGQPASECAQLRLTCGNGRNDPGEDCKNCAFDNGCPSGLICGNINGGEDYTCHYPAGLCLADP